jgi:hypothetical protein
MIVSEDNAGALEDSADRGIEFARDLRLGPPHWPQDGCNIYGRDFMNGPREERPAVCGPKMALPLVSDLGVDRFLLCIGDDELGDRLKGWNWPRSLLGRSLRLNRVDALAYERAVLCCLCARILEADVRIRSEPLVLSDARHLVTQNPFLAASSANDEMQPPAVSVPSSLGGLNAPFGQLAIAGPTPSPTLRRGLWHTMTDGGRRSSQKTTGIAANCGTAANGSGWEFGAG